MKTLLILLALVSSAAAAVCGLKWNPNPEPEVTGYRVWCGIDCIASVTEPRASLDLPTDRLSTLTVTAVSATGESEHSDPLTVRPITPESAEVLKPWIRQRTFFVPNTPRHFFRFSYPAQ
jgi:hypothetical protein